MQTARTERIGGLRSDGRQRDGQGIGDFAGEKLARKKEAWKSTLTHSVKMCEMISRLAREVVFDSKN